MDSRYRLLTLGTCIHLAHSMPSRDVNAATRLAEASLRRDKILRYRSPWGFQVVINFFNQNHNLFVLCASKILQFHFHPKFILIYSIIFWTDRGTLKIERSSYDGTERRAIVTSSLYWPNSLAIDRKRRFSFNEF